MAQAVKVRGVAEFKSGTRRLSVKIKQQAGRNFAQIASNVEQNASGKVPRRSGRLASTLFSDSTETGGRVGYREKLPYTGWIEFGGTRGRPYKPRGRYLYPAVMRERRQLVKAANDAAEKAIGGMTWPSP